MEESPLGEGPYCIRNVDLPSIIILTFKCISVIPFT